jgi:hypothetical protein
MERRYPVLGLVLILVGVGGLLLVSPLGGSSSRFDG